MGRVETVFSFNYRTELITFSSMNTVALTEGALSFMSIVELCITFIQN